MNYRILRVVSWVIGGLLVTSQVEGQVSKPVGTKVVTKKQTALYAGTRVANDDGELRVYTVERVEGDWLWLVSGSVSGWVRSSQILALDQAIHFYTREIQANSAGAAAARAYLSRGVVRAEKGDTGAALADFNEALRLDPMCVAALRNRGAIWNEKGVHDRAIADLNEAIRLRPNDTGAFYNRAVAWLDQEEYEKAINDFNEAIRLDPKSAESFRTRGHTRNKMRQYDRAITDLNEAIRLNPNVGRAYFHRGVALVMNGRYDAAISDFNEAIRQDKSYPEAFANRAATWKLKGDYPKAIADFNEAIRLDPNDPIHFYKRGMALMESGDDDRAIADFTETIRLDPTSGMVVAGLARGTAWGHKREYAKALGDFKEVVRLDPHNSSAQNNMAFLWSTCPDARFRDGRRAVESATRACELTREEVPTFLATLAAAYAETGDIGKAVAWQAKANKLCTEVEEKKNGELRLSRYKRGKPYRE
jgi:tetratricopeptide (TPR) repeat protein